MDSFFTDCFRNGHLALKPAEQIQLTDLGQTGEHGVVTDDDHAMACRNSIDRRASAKISSADWSGHTACLLSIACASQSEPNLSILLICSSESTSLEYASPRQCLKSSMAEVLESRAQVSCQIIRYIHGQSHHLMKTCHSSLSIKSQNAMR